MSGRQNPEGINPGEDQEPSQNPGQSDGSDVIGGGREGRWGGSSDVVGGGSDLGPDVGTASREPAGGGEVY
ncbi:MAG TPA: hypothetical protein VJZ91_04025 [Blastocatellia bacterium]|nr:hypothetical protein [Blastocatellia bacterium]